MLRDPAHHPRPGVSPDRRVDLTMPVRARASRRGIAGVPWPAILGETLITAGALYLLFLFWQNVWTTVAYDHDAARLNAAIEEDWDTTPPAADPLPATEAWTADQVPVAAEPDAQGTVFARLWVPRFGDDPVPIAQGIDKATILDRIGMGHYPGTAMPGQVGNLALAGHRTSYGRPLNKIDSLRTGDPIIVETEDAWYVYRYTDHAIVQPEQTEVIAPVPNQPGVAPAERSITLTACHPLYSRAQRWVAWGVFDGWMPKTAGTPAELSSPTARPR